ncbi:protocadherin gamma-A4-like [Etheostoma cragini]|uniref:protocadherin gamma-A4-like n=1 Tax=Etheostoma cragini TaxID=417921 RepID=UPI00155F44CC|nr:protocadherin gamma-A4-like [Etheostoma cragini]
MDSKILVFQTCGFHFLLFLHAAYGDMSYSFPEEMKRGSVIGNMAKDLGLDTGALSNRRARIDTDGTDKRYCDINLNNGELTVADRIDREGLCGEKASCILKHELVLENPLELHRISFHIKDINDNSPQFKEAFINLEIRESAVKGARFVIEEAHDADVGENSVQQYSLKKNDNFVLSVDGNTIELVLEKELDREKQQEINLLLTALDGGSPQRSGTVVIHVTVLDANDNAPVFSQAVYKASLPENSPVDTVVVTVSATDADEGVNGDVTYEFGHVTEDVKKIFSIDRKVGEIRVVGAVDYETTTSMVPRSADVGYLVTKVVAVDVDSGQNVWLSYKLQKAKDRALFEVGLQNGEIRTIRQVTDKDAVKQRLTVIVEDNGQPFRSATVVVNVAVADSFPEVLSEFTDFTHDKEYNDNLTFYLVLALAVVSVLFITCLVVIISVKIYRWRQSRILYHSNLPVIPYYPPRYSDTLGTGTLQHVYNYEVCRTTDSRKSDCKFGRAGSQNVLKMDPTSTGTMQRIQSEKNILDEPDSPLEVRKL